MAKAKKEKATTGKPRATRKGKKKKPTCHMGSYYYYNQ